MIALLRTKYFYYVVYAFFILLILANNSLKADQELKIISNSLLIDKEANKINAKGDVLISGKEIFSKADNIIYNKNDGIIKAEGNILLKDKFGNNYFLDEMTIKDDFSYLNADNAKIRLKDNSRMVGNKIMKRNELNIISNVEYTSCLKENYLIENCPGWKLKANKAYHNLESKTIHYNHARLHIFNIPVFYLPYFAHPDPSVNKRTGFLMPTFQTDDQLGDVFSLPFFYDISENKDITITPNLQSNANNFYEINYRHLNEIGSMEISASLDDNNDSNGTRNHFFANSKINNNYGSLNAYIQTSNNDTYMRKMNLNDATVYKSGINFERSYKNTNLLIESNAYKHLTRQDSEQWEYLYPQINYDINSINDEDFGGNVSLNNTFRNWKSLDNSYSSHASSQLNWTRSEIHQQTGLLFNNQFNFRIVSASVDNKSGAKDESSLLFFPQIASKISFPLVNVSKNYSQTLTPILIPILAPYNNNTDAQPISTSNVFSYNRATGLDQWESGPRINYGIEWFLNLKKNFDIKFTIGQSAKINKYKHELSDEISDYMATSRIIFDLNKYIDNTMIVDRHDNRIKGISTHSHFEYNNFRFAIDHDYVSEKYGTGSEQIRIGGNILLKNDFSFNFTGTRNLNTDNNIGYQYGLLYENECLGVDLNYYKDLTIDRDIVESDGFSLSIVLKPFGSTKSYGKKRLFGPEI
jgi:LPS-assembly protein